jgi:hypothetical protein
LPSKIKSGHSSPCRRWSLFAVGCAVGEGGSDRQEVDVKAYFGLG